MIGDFSVAFIHTLLDEKERIHVEPPREVVKDKSVLWKLRKALNGLRRAILLFQNFLFGICTEKLGFKKVVSAPTVVCHTETNVKILLHVDDPLCIEEAKLFTAL